MTKTNATGQSCVGELRLLPIDVGFDLRDQDMEVHLPDQFASVGLRMDGESWLITGTREEMVEAIKDAGYNIAE